MAQSIVDVFEVVEVEEHGRDGEVAPVGTRQHLSCAVEDQLPIGQPGERVVQSLEMKLLSTFEDQRRRPSPSRAQEVDDKTKQQAQRDARDEKGQRACVA